MTTSLDGKVTGEHLSRANHSPASEVYYEYNRSLKADGFICGRVTMEGSFTGGWYPDLNRYPAVQHDPGSPADFIVDDLSGFYAVAFDSRGRLGWQSNRIIDPDGDPGYDHAQIIEVLTEQVDPRYLGYLQALKIPYIFAGETEINVEFALCKLKHLLGINCLLLEGGSILNGAFQRAGVIDELSLVVDPVIGGEGKPLCMDSRVEEYRLVDLKNYDGILWMHYRRNNNA
ncbi:MAG: dihydrofolate reductase family protein, partial [Clostridia bacterium]|nr:dihydrofolate reductase family protein [Clostridia bacterium]